MNTGNSSHEQPPFADFSEKILPTKFSGTIPPHTYRTNFVERAQANLPDRNSSLRGLLNQQWSPHPPAPPLLLTPRRLVDKPFQERRIKSSPKGYLCLPVGIELRFLLLDNEPSDWWGTPARQIEPSELCASLRIPPHLRFVRGSIV